MAHPPHSNYLPVRQEWLDRRHEPAIDPDLPMVDAHQHLWERPGWRYLLDEMLADVNASGHNIVATVFMQCQAMYRPNGDPALRPVGETEFVNGIAASAASGTYGPTRVCAGIVGHADLRLGAEVERVLEAHIRAGGGRFCGIRHIVVWDADKSLMNPLSAGPQGLMADARFREGFSRLAPLGLSFDAWLFHPQIDELTDLARAFPETTIIPDHIGGVVGIGAYSGKREDVFARWSTSMRTLEKSCPNVSVKLGGLGMRINGFGFERGCDPPTSQELVTALRPYIETCIALFGADRCMFESNFPVDKGSYGYGTLWNAFKILTRNASSAERSALFSGTAARTYRLEHLADVSQQ